MVAELLTTETFIFDSVINLALFIILILVYTKTRELYTLSLEKGIRYLNYAMLFYLIGISFNYAIVLVNFLTQEYFAVTPLTLIIRFFNIMGSSLGGFYLAYCIMWRKFEHFRKSPTIITAKLVCISLFIASAETFLLVNYGVQIPFIYFGILIAVLLFAILTNHECCTKKQKEMPVNPYLSLVGLSLGVYVVLFIEALLLPVLFTVHFYSKAIVLVFALTFYYHVQRVL